MTQAAAARSSWTESHPSDRVERVKASLLILGGFVVLGTVLRCATLGHQSFGHDEAVTVGRILHPGFGATLQEIPRSERTPYLYYVLAWAWTRVFGMGAVGVRSLSALFGVLTIPVAFGAGRAAVSKRAGLMAAALIAVDPFLVYYSQEARSYALFALLATCSLWAFVSILRRPSTHSLLAWGLIAALALATHYFAIFLVAGEALCLLAVVRPRRRALLAMAPPVVVGGALIALLVRQANHQTGGVDETTLARQLPTALVQFMFGERLSIRGLYTATPLLGVAVLLLMCLLTWLAWHWRWRKLSAIGAVGLFALLAPFVSSVVGAHYFNARNCIGCLVALLILLGGVLSLGQVGRLGLATVVVLCVCGLGMSVAMQSVPALQRPDYRDADALLGNRLTGQRALVISQGGDTPTLIYRASHDPESWPARSEPVSEIDVLGANDSSPGAPPPAGFHILEQQDTGTVRVTRLAAGTPRLVSHATLTSLAPSGGTFTLLLETHG
ncbi:MAG TPA: glycosyltransferase family 39 protein [Solirubrobacteraceae bacterium]|nr:glycosyltransferase family 39 protein [Solirubrobacteraceae bacterium]